MAEERPTFGQAARILEIVKESGASSKDVQRLIQNSDLLTTLLGTEKLCDVSRKIFVESLTKKEIHSSLIDRNYIQLNRLAVDRGWNFDKITEGIDVRHRNEILPLWEEAVKRDGGISRPALIKTKSIPDPNNCKRSIINIMDHLNSRRLSPGYLALLLTLSWQREELLDAGVETVVAAQFTSPTGCNSADYCPFLSLRHNRLGLDQFHVNSHNHWLLVVCNGNSPFVSVQSL